MLYCIFKSKLKRLNPHLRIFENCPATERPWGIYLVKRQGLELEHLCGINPIAGMVYERTERRWDGYILRQGWRRVLNILIKKHIINKQKAAREFSTSFEENRGKDFTVGLDPLTQATNEAKAIGLRKTGLKDYIDLDDLVDIHRMREKYRRDKSNYWA